MIDLELLRENPENFKEACVKKGINFDIDAFVALDADYRKSKIEIDALRSERNTVSKKIPSLSAEDKNEALARMKVVSEQLKGLEQSFAEVEQQWKRQQYLIPGIPLPQVPVGKTDADNVENRRWGTVPEFNFTSRDHVELSEILDLFDTERGVKIAGARSYFLKGDAARLQHAVLNYSLDLLHKRGYTIMDCPHIVKYDAMLGTSYFPGGEEMAYHLDERDEGFYLIGTSEVSVCSYHADEILDLSKGPKRYAGYSPCYRREAGTYGKDTRGLYRVHQFYKVEQVVICEADADQSMALHMELLGNAEALLQALKLPYRIVDVCTGDMGQGQVFKYDIECWMPGRKAYGETHSCSSFYDFQARRLGIRYRDAQGRSVYCYTLNNTCVASPRILIPILENYQQADGSVVIPEVLRPYMGGQEVIVPR
jgi:seryl-tRNA synthetase